MKRVADSKGVVRASVENWENCQADGGDGKKYLQKDSL